MMDSIVRVVQIVAVIGTFSSCIYYLLCLWSAARFLREGKVDQGIQEEQFSPPISILKPLKGTDPEIYESFRSHCLQDYPEYEIIFGVSDPNDPAIESVKKLQREFPDRRIQLLVCSKILGANVKVSNLAQMLAEARYDWLIVNDSDIRVEPDYLRRVTAPLADPRVGMVTCLYRGVAAAMLGSHLEGLGISTDFCPSVLVARQLEGGIRFGLGSTLAFRRAELEKIGGFTSFVDYLADDYELGKRIAGLGLTVKLSDVVVETYLPSYRLAGVLCASTSLGSWSSGRARGRVHGSDFYVWDHVVAADSGRESSGALGLGCAHDYAASSSRGGFVCRPRRSAGPSGSQIRVADSPPGFVRSRCVGCEPGRPHRYLARGTFLAEGRQADSDRAVATNAGGIISAALGTVWRL